MSHSFQHILAQHAQQTLASNDQFLNDHELPLELEPFTPGGLGLFPYVWQDPRNQLFNEDTYQWISANVKAGAYPIEQAVGSTFTNLFSRAFGSVSFALSSADVKELARESDRIFQEQSKVLNKWIKIFGAVPIKPNKEPIDVIIDVIATSWASPSTTFAAMQNAQSLSELLNQVPPSGMPLLPILINYIDTLNASISLQNATPRQQGNINSVLKALDHPNLKNGGIQTNKNQIVPAYEVMTPVAAIIDGLNKTENNFTVTTLITRLNEKNLLLEFSENEAATLPHSELRLFENKTQQSSFEKIIQSSKAPLYLEMKFSGLTMVYFQPVDFMKSNGQNWFWATALQAALENKNKDVTGFRFSPYPLIDFSKNGPFGYLSAVAISKQPKVNLLVGKNDWTDMKRSLSGDFLNKVTRSEGEKIRPYLTKGAFETFSKMGQDSAFLSWDAQEKTSGNLDARAWVHGVQVNFPLAKD